MSTCSSVSIPKVNWSKNEKILSSPPNLELKEAKQQQNPWLGGGKLYRVIYEQPLVGIIKKKIWAIFQYLKINPVKR